MGLEDDMCLGFLWTFQRKVDRKSLGAEPWLSSKVVWTRAAPGVDSGDAEEDVGVHQNCLEPDAVMCSLISLYITVYQLYISAQWRPRQKTLGYIARPFFMIPPKKP